MDMKGRTVWKCQHTLFHVNCVCCYKRYCFNLEHLHRNLIFSWCFADPTDDGWHYETRLLLELFFVQLMSGQIVLTLVGKRHPVLSAASFVLCLYLLKIAACFSSSSQSEQPSPAGSSSSSSFAPTPHKRQGNRLGPCTQVTKFSLCCLLVTLTSYVTLRAVKAM